MEQNLRLQASIFGDFKEIDLSQDSMMKLYQIYLNEKMMPAVIKEFDMLSQKLNNRPSFTAQDNSIAISITSERFDITSDMSAGDKMPNKDEFVKRAIKFYKSFFEVFEVGICRISFILERIVRTMEEPKEEINNFINTSHVYNCDNVFEWSSNSVSLDDWDINGRSEKINLNITTAMRRINAIQHNQPVLLNGLVVIQDLNSVAENTTTRFSIDDISSYLNLAKEKSDIISNMIEGEKNE